MKKECENRAALAIVAAVAGTGYASGRELVLFFAQTGPVGWAGVAFAAAVFGALTALLCRWAGQLGAGDVPALCRRGIPGAPGRAAGWAYGLLMALTAAAMLCSAGEIGALTLPLAQGGLWGMGLALLIALGMRLSRLKALPGLGLALLVAGTVYYTALALDPRPPRVWLRGGVTLALEGSLPAALLLGLTYAAMNACLAAGPCLRFGAPASPKGVGLRCTAMLLLLLGSANWAVVRGGRDLLGQAMPTVLLSARWGVAGFWLCAAFSFLCAVTTLSAALDALLTHPRGGILGAVGATVAALTALYRGVGAAYPAVGWLCAVLLLALACRGERALSWLGKVKFRGENP